MAQAPHLPDGVGLHQFRVSHGVGVHQRSAVHDTEITIVLPPGARGTFCLLSWPVPVLLTGAAGLARLIWGKSGFSPLFDS